VALFSFSIHLLGFVSSYCDAVDITEIVKLISHILCTCNACKLIITGMDRLQSFQLFLFYFHFSLFLIFQGYNVC